MYNKLIKDRKSKKETTLNYVLTKIIDKLMISC